MTIKLIPLGTSGLGEILVRTNRGAIAGAIAGGAESGAEGGAGGGAGGGAAGGALDSAGWFHTGDLGRWEEADEEADSDGPPGRGVLPGGEGGAGGARGVEVRGAAGGGRRGAPRWRLRVVERLGFVVKLSNGEFLAPQRVLRPLTPLVPRPTAGAARP